MALSTKARKRLETALAHKTEAIEVANAIDAGSEFVAAVYVNLGTPAAGGVDLADINDWDAGQSWVVLQDTWTNAVFSSNRAFTGDLTLTIVGDSLSGISITETVNTLTVHYQSGVSTKAAILAYVNANSKLMNTTGSHNFGGGVATSPTDDVASATLTTNVKTADEILEFFNTGVSPAVPVPAQLDIPRTVDVSFSLHWRGGNVSVSGLDQFSKLQTETFTSTPGSTVTGSIAWSRLDKAYRTLTAAINGDNNTQNNASLLSGASLGVLHKMHDNVVSVIVGGTTMENPASTNVTNSTIATTTSLDGSTNFKVLLNSEAA